VDIEALAEFFVTFDMDDLNKICGMFQYCMRCPSNNTYKFYLETRVPAMTRLGILLLKWKSISSISIEAFKLLRTILALAQIDIPSYSTIVQSLERIVGIKPRIIDCCLQSHMCFSGRHRFLSHCWCGAARYQRPEPEDDPDRLPLAIEEEMEGEYEEYMAIDFTNQQRQRNRETPRRPVKYCIYIPLIPRLLLQYANPARANTLKNYKRETIESWVDSNEEVTTDFWTGTLFHQYLADNNILQGDSVRGSLWQ
jgi:hypothetical protein